MYFSICGVAGSGKSFLLSELKKKGFSGENYKILFKKKLEKEKKLKKDFPFLTEPFSLTKQEFDQLKLQNKKKLFFFEGVESYLLPKIKGVIVLLSSEEFSKEEELFLVENLKKKGVKEEQILENLLAEKEKTLKKTILKMNKRCLFLNYLLPVEEKIKQIQTFVESTKKS